MASIRQRNGRWQARVSRKGFPDEVKTFDTKSAAQQWARSAEAQLDLTTRFPQRGEIDGLFGDMLERYSQTVTPGKRGADDEQIRIRMLRRYPIARYSMAHLTPAVIAAFRDERLRTVSAGTVIRDLAVISSVINHARREWQIQIQNACDMVRKPAPPQGRNRLLSHDELKALLDALKPQGRRSPWLRPLVELALETAMRRGELLALRWSEIDLQARTACLQLTKNGRSRLVPLSLQALAILAELPRHESGQLFPLTYMATAAAFKKACMRAGIENFHFHDLRHMAATRMAQKLPNVIELSAVTGHQSVQMLKRYYHPDATALARKLDHVTLVTKM